MALIAAHAKIAIFKSSEALRKVLQAIRSALTANVYRPELHYMRGPGPRTRKVSKSD